MSDCLKHLDCPNQGLCVDCPLACDHPECRKPHIGGSINGGRVCADHIEWAMERAFLPIERLEDVLDDS